MNNSTEKNALVEAQAAGPSLTRSRRLVRAKVAANYTDISLGRLYELVRRDEVPHVRYGSRQLRFDLDQLDRWLDQGGSGEPGDWREGGK